MTDHLTPAELQAAQDQAVDAAAGRTITPTPGGLAARAAAEHDAAAKALNAGDVDAAIGHDQLAAALSAAELAERPPGPTIRTAL